MNQTKLLPVMLVALGVACACAAGDVREILVTTHAQTAAVAVAKYADPFTGEIDEVAVFTPAGVTGAVAVAAIDPYSGSSLVLATNEAATGYMVWKPRIVAPVVGGAEDLTVTNTASLDRFYALGERLLATVSDASKTSQTFRIRVKVK